MAYFDDTIPISHIRQYLFCPRIPWYKHVMCFEPPEQGWVTQGRRWHEAQNPRHKRRLCHYIEGARDHALNVYVHSHSLGVHGYVDELISNENKCVVIEYKVDGGKPTIAQKLQLITYVIAAQEYLHRDVVAGVLLKGSAKKQYHIPLDNALKVKLRKILSELRTVLANHRMPFSSASDAKCEQCEYLRYCNDR